MPLPDVHVVALSDGETEERGNTPPCLRAAKHLQLPQTAVAATTGGGNSCCSSKSGMKVFFNFIFSGSATHWKQTNKQTTTTKAAFFIRDCDCDCGWEAVATKEKKKKTAAKWFSICDKQRFKAATRQLRGVCAMWPSEANLASLAHKMCRRANYDTHGSDYKKIKNKIQVSACGIIICSTKSYPLLYEYIFKIHYKY